MAKSDFERKAEQFRNQIEDLRSNLDDALKSYNKLMSSSADWLTMAQRPIASTMQQAKNEVENVGGIPWWIPVAVVGVIGIGYWLYNTFFAPVSEQMQQPFANYQAGGNQSTFGTAETTYTEQG